MDKRQENAIACLNQGFNCAQSVLYTFAEEIGLNKDDALKIASGFGGGMRRGATCGAVTGAIMAIGSKYGHFIVGDTKAKEKAYRLTGELQERFEEIHGTIVCKELLGYDLSKEEDMKIVIEKGLFNTICPMAIKDSISLLEELL